MITGTLHKVFPMEDASRVGEARRHAAQLAHDCGLDEVAAGRLALVVTELGTNLVRHAVAGRLLLSSRAARAEVEVIAVDEGPGIADVERCLVDGFSTGGTPGTGLGAIGRLADEFDIYTKVSQGTVAVARVRAARSARSASTVFSAGAVSLAAPGESVCGDGWAFAFDGDHASVLVVDGLGHGPDAALAARVAIEGFAEEPMSDPRQLLQSTHRRLRATRGAAVMMLRADAAGNVIRSSGAGNVIGRLLSGVSDRTILTQHGTAGLTIRTPEEVSTPWPPHAMLVVCSDGITSRWTPDVLTPLLGRDPALAAAVLARDHLRGPDDATIAVLRRRG